MSVKQNKSVAEFNISVPWGHIAVKTWGTRDDPHVLMIHGTSDNAGTFDNLMPLLVNGFYYICIDLPSHGKSSHFPPYLPIHSTQFILVCKLVADYFNKEEYIFIGHSLGGQIGFSFAQVYPQYFKLIISIDALPQFFPIEAKNTVKYLRKLIDKNIDLQEKMVKEKAISYTYDELLENFCKNRYQDEILTRIAAEPMLQRCIIETDDGKYTLSTDERMTAAIRPLNDSRYKILSIKNDPVSCPVFVIFAKHNSFPRKHYSDLVKAFKKLKNVRIVYVDGKHDVHNNHPELVATHINKCLVTLKAKM